MSIEKLAIIISTLALVGCGPSEKEVELQEQMDWVEDYPKFAGIGWFSTNEEVKSTMLKQGYTFDKEFEEPDFEIIGHKFVEGDPALRQVYKGELLGQNATITIRYSSESSLKSVVLDFNKIEQRTAASFANQLKSTLIHKYSEPDEFFNLKEGLGHYSGWSFDPKLDDSASYMATGLREDSGEVFLRYSNPVYAKEENLRTLQMRKAAETKSNQDDL